MPAAAAAQRCVGRPFAWPYALYAAVPRVGEGRGLRSCAHEINGPWSVDSRHYLQALLRARACVWRRKGAREGFVAAVLGACEVWVFAVCLCCSWACVYVGLRHPWIPINVCAVGDGYCRCAESLNVFKIARGCGQCTSGEITAKGMGCNRAHCKGAPGTSHGCLGDYTRLRYQIKPSPSSSHMLDSQ